jgi:hydroxymethylglutaryl-CoA lyase
VGPANVWAAVSAGVHVIDSSLGGLGGCPFAPNATGNVATEDVAWLLHRSGLWTGLDVQSLIETNHWFAGIIGRALPAALGRAGDFRPQGAVS